MRGPVALRPPSRCQTKAVGEPYDPNSGAFSRPYPPPQPIYQPTNQLSGDRLQPDSHNTLPCFCGVLSSGPFPLVGHGLLARRDPTPKSYDSSSAPPPPPLLGRMCPRRRHAGAGWRITRPGRGPRLPRRLSR
ncbi:hypothetical protein LX36DRAFT_109364 [Colletotrichum falcatum]|nr:hypothetical protein LX36DRAFT_109364 [Colletotrichum falcatum]